MGKLVTISTSALEYQPSKKRKIEKGDNTLSKPWLTFNGIELTEQDKAAILSGDWLTDKHMNFTQTLLKKQFDTIEGLQQTLVLTKLQHLPFSRSR